MLVKKIRFLNNVNTDFVTFEVEFFENALEENDLFIYIQLGEDKMLFPSFLKKSINTRVLGNKNFYFYRVNIQEYSEEIRNIIRDSQESERFSNIKIKYYITDSLYENIVEKGVFVDTDGFLSRNDVVQGLEENVDLIRNLDATFNVIPCYDNQFSKFSNISQISQINKIKIKFNSAAELEHELTLQEFSILNNFLFTDKTFQFLRDTGSAEDIISAYTDRIVSIIDNAQSVSPSSTNYISYENLLLVKEDLDSLVFNNDFQHVDIEIYVGNFDQYLQKRFIAADFSGINLIREFLTNLLEVSRIQNAIENITSSYDNNRLTINFSNDLSEFYSNSFITSVKVYNNLTMPVLQKELTRENFYCFNEVTQTNELVNFSLFNLERISNNNSIFLPTQSSRLEDIEFANLSAINNSYNNFYKDGYFLEINLVINNDEYNIKTKLEMLNVAKTERETILNNNVIFDFFNFYTSLNSIQSVENNSIIVNLSDTNSVIRNNIFSYLGYSQIINESVLSEFLNRLYINYTVIDNEGSVKYNSNFRTFSWTQNTSSNKIFTTALEDDIEILETDVILCRLYCLKKETHDANTSLSFRRELIDTFSNNSITELIQIADGLFAVEADYEIYIENLFRIIDKVIV